MADNDSLPFDHKSFSYVLPLDNHKASPEHLDEIIISEGFYVTLEKDKDGSMIPGVIYHVPESDDQYWTMAKTAAKFAVADYNRNSNLKRSWRSLKFLDIQRLNIQLLADGVIIYYVTMSMNVFPVSVLYQAKICEKLKLNSQYEVQIFRRAPFSETFFERYPDDRYCCVRVLNLLPWMDISYLYYKCFNLAHEKILSIWISEQSERDKPKHFSLTGMVHVRSSEAANEFPKMYEGKMMPLADKEYKLEPLLVDDVVFLC